jgi:hypothetical protein
MTRACPRRRGSARVLVLAATVVLLHGSRQTVDAEQAGALRLDFTSAVNVSESDDVSEYPVLAHDGEHLYVAWEETYDNLLMLSRSDDEGVSFTIPGAFVPGEGFSFGQAHLASLGIADVHLAFTAFDLYSGGAEIAHAGSNDAAATFPQLSIISSVDEMNSYAPSVAAGWGLAVVWSNVYTWTGAATIEIALSTDAGATFPAPKRVDVADLDAEQCPSVALGREGSVFVAWKTRYQPILGAATEGILFARSTDGGQTFELPVNLSTEPYEVSWCPRLAADTSGHVYVLWVEGALANKRLLLAVSEDGGASFSAPRVLDGVAEDLDGELVVAPDQALWITWMRAAFAGSGIEQLVTRSIDGGKRFAPPAALPGPHMISSPYSLTAASGERVFVVWNAIPENPGPGVRGSDIFVSRGDIVACGDANEDGTATAVDALSALRVAVGMSFCAACRCDADASGSVSASDALAILRVAVGQPLSLVCPKC